MVVVVTDKHVLSVVTDKTARAQFLRVKRIRVKI